jgi:hypothetical protein
MPSSHGALFHAAAYRRVAFRRAGVLVLAAAAALLSATAVLAPAASADETEQPTDETRRSWSVQPAGPDGEADTRAAFALTAQPGQTYADRVLVSNYSRRPLTLDLYATDATNTPDGSFSLLTAAETPQGVGAWVQLGQRRITVPARSASAVPFTVVVPADATPGDHAGAVVASVRSAAEAADGRTVDVDQRAGTRVYARVPGEVSPSLALEDVRTTYSAAANPLDGAATVTWTVRNTGNVRLSAQQSVEVSGLFGLGSSRRDASDGLADVRDLLPGETATVSQTFDGVPAALRVTGEVRLDPYIPAITTGAEPEALTAVSSSASTWAISWWALLAVALLVAAAALWRERRRRATRRAADAHERALEEARAAGRAEAAGSVE